jgi:hypothetical protein
VVGERTRDERFAHACGTDDHHLVVVRHPGRAHQ